MNRGRVLAESWDKNAGNWTRAVREGLIPSRRAGTDAAVVDVIVALKPARLIDVGCGEGWLIRRLTRALGCTAVGIDGSRQLVADAQTADPGNDYRVMTYGELIAGAGPFRDPFDVAVFNYSLFDEAAPQLLAAARPLLGPGGTVVIQTLHPWSLPPGEPYRDGWRVENFSAFENQDWAPMPWYFRTLESWLGVVRDAGLMLTDLKEPAAEPGGRPLSLLMVARC